MTGMKVFIVTEAHGGHVVYEVREDAGSVGEVKVSNGFLDAPSEIEAKFSAGPVRESFHPNGCECALCADGWLTVTITNHPKP